MRNLAKLFIVFGLLCYAIGIYLIWQKNDPNRISFAGERIAAVYDKTPVENPPVRIIIDELNIDIPILPAKIEDGKWDTTTDGASYLITSAIPGNEGNSIVYAHDWASLFGPLVNVKENMLIQIEYRDTSRKKFIVMDVFIVDQNRMDIIKPGDDRKLTLFTCIGFLDSQRLVAVASFSDDISIGTN